MRVNGCQGGCQEKTASATDSSQTGREVSQGRLARGTDEQPSFLKNRLVELCDDGVSPLFPRENARSLRIPAAAQGVFGTAFSLTALAGAPAPP
jgi:hypothetical protein